MKFSSKVIVVSSLILLIIITLAQFLAMLEPSSTIFNNEVFIKHGVDSNAMYAFSGIGSTGRRYKEGSRVVYESLYGCQRPEFLREYTSPCWRDSSQIACAARVMLLGFHKCGTSDLSKWFYDKSTFSTAAIGQFRTNKTLGVTLVTGCPAAHIEGTRTKYYNVPTPNENTTVYVDCPGCVLVSRMSTSKRSAELVIRQSAIQYIQEFMRDNSRYIITMRNPTDRVLSHYFYAFKINDFSQFSWFADKTKVEDIGFGVLHKQVVAAVDTLQRCLAEFGITECILAEPGTGDGHVIMMLIRHTCYSVYIRETLKFIPMEKIYFSRMEDYSTNPEKVVKEIFDFIGEPNHKWNKALIGFRHNVGATSKPVLQETIELLDKFFEPFNEELAEMLEDDKWKFYRETPDQN